MSIDIQVPVTSQQLDSLRDLMRAFVTWHRERHLEDLDLINRYFDAATFEEELASLPGKYTPPSGQLLLASWSDLPAGCVALREIDRSTCEMKRMFVYTQFQGKGIGRALAEEVIEQARSMDYRSMVLDTSIRQKEAMTLYRRLGFRDIEPYYELAEDMRNWLVFMELKL